MKIMDLSSDDGECQVEAVINVESKKIKQVRLPFQTLSTDSPKANKKRKSVASPDCRSAKQAKVITKNNSLKASEKNQSEDIIIIDEKESEEKEEKNTSNNVKNNSKIEETHEKASPKNKKTPGRRSGKHKKSEPKVQVNSLTKFLKVIDNKDNKTEAESPSSKSKKSKTETNVDTESKEILEKSKTENGGDTKQNNDVIESSKNDTKKVIDESHETESKDSSSSKENEEADASHLNETENMEVDSDIHSDSNDSHDDVDDDSQKSDTDSKKTEHEDTDSKDDTSRSNSQKSITPAKNKLLDSKSNVKKLTPKQAEKKLEIQKKREIRDKQRQEREKKLQEERESRKREKEEKQREREEKKREREEKEKMAKEQKRKEKELKEQKKQAELELKQKEKEAKEEDRRKREEAKEEEKKRKEEEKLEAERKKQKAASNFVSFFVPKKPVDAKPVEEEQKVEKRNFMPFEVKADMRLAPAVRRKISESEKSKLDDLVIKSNVNKSNLYISELKSDKYKIRKAGNTWPPEGNDDIVILEDDDEESANIVQAKSAEKHRAKLFLFHENRRPPYFGTWRKKSKSINPRRPLAKDEKCFDYEVDSDDEWEEEEPGESLRGSDDEKDKDEEDPDENDYDVDNEFMVPHGYLSDEEIMADEEDDEDDLNPENQKNKLKVLGEQFEAERKTKTTKLKPKVIGCVWLHKDNTYPESVPSHTSSFLTERQAWVRQIPVVLTAPAEADNAFDETGTPLNKSSIASSARKAKAVEEATPDIVRLVHGNRQSCAFLIKEFVEFWNKKKNEENPLPKRKIQQRIKEIAVWTTCSVAGPLQGKFCWWVSEEIRTKYFGEEKLPIPNTWTYCLEPKKRQIVESAEKVDDKEKDKEKEKKTVPLITQFTKTLTTEEMQKQLAEKSSSTPNAVEKASASTSVPKATPPSNRPPKRATLISVPRGESISKSPRVSLMDKFVSKDGTTSTPDSKNTKKPKSDDLDDGDCMIIDDSDENDDTTHVSTKYDDAKKSKETEIKEKLKEDQNITVESEKVSEKANHVSANSDADIIGI